MAIEANFTEDDDIFVGEDKTLRFHIFADDEGEAAEDVASFALAFTVRPFPASPSTTISKTSGSGIAVTGSFNSTPASNTQRIVVTLTDTDLSISPRSYAYSLKRTDDGFETVLAFGTFPVKRATIA